jgi:DNA invertase Pin-like site-specific DNA recombinase
MMTSKITDQHLSRVACIYIRQSTPGTGALQSGGYRAPVQSQEQGAHDPADFNDSLVLGLKGTFAQAELHIIRAHLHGGKLNKARKGELKFSLPVGYVYDGDEIVLDPDQEVQGAVRTVFELLQRDGTVFVFRVANGVAPGTAN